MGPVQHRLTLSRILHAFFKGWKENLRSVTKNDHTHCNQKTFKFYRQVEPCPRPTVPLGQTVSDHYKYGDEMGEGAEQTEPGYNFQGFDKHAGQQTYKHNNGPGFLSHR